MTLDGALPAVVMVVGLMTVPSRARAQEPVPPVQQPPLATRSTNQPTPELALDSGGLSGLSGSSTGTIARKEMAADFSRTSSPECWV
jgi:hypothetical protein